MYIYIYRQGHDTSIKKENKTYGKICKKEPKKLSETEKEKLEKEPKTQEHIKNDSNKYNTGKQ